MNTSQLLSLLDAAGIDPQDYRVLTEWPEDGLHLVREGEMWEIHWHERGGRFDVETFDSEDTACVSFLRRMLLLHQAAAGKGPSA